MLIEFDCSVQLSNVVKQAATSCEEFNDEFDPQIRTADPRFGDFQANGVLPFAKKAGLNPRELSEKLLKLIPHSDYWNTSLAGPGFINFKLSEKYFFEWSKKFSDNQSIRTAIKEKKTKKVVFDFSSPNTAKQMHVGHIRSTIIGESLSRLFDFFGHQVIRDNHLGDWGTQFGILLLSIKKLGVSLEDLGTDPIAKLEDLYRQGNQWVKDNESNLDEARTELVKLQNGDSENLTLWDKIKEISMDSFLKIYDLLDVKFDFSLGESFYRDKVDGIYTKLLSFKICKEDDGALVVFHPEHKRFAKQPFIIRKSDGASNYATTDLATVQYRFEKWNAEEIIYVTDGRQRDHFEQLFLTVKKWFSAEDISPPKLFHVWFGTILGDDNKAIKTRDGQPIKLIDLLKEAIERAKLLIVEKNPSLDSSEVEKRAKIIGLGAVKYADLSQDRTLDYVFSWDKMLAMQGNTAPYLQYAVARINSIFRKAQSQPEDTFNIFQTSLSESERNLFRKLIFFPVVLKQTAKELKPHFLCTYLYELSTDFSSFYNQNKVMVEDEKIRNNRLLLCSRTILFLKTGMDILGIETLQEM